MRYEIVPRTGVNPQDAASNCSGRDTDGVYAHRIGAECLAFSEIYERYHSKIFRLALRITRNFQDAEDVVQECFMRAFVHLDSLSGKSKLSTWLWRIAINAALMRIRRRRGFDFSLDSFAGTASSARRVDIKCHRPAPDDQYLQREIAQILVEGLAGLSPKLSSVVTLRLSLQSTFNKHFRRSPRLAPFIAIGHVRFHRLAGGLLAALMPRD